MNKTNILAAAIGVIATTAIVAATSYAYQGGLSTNNNTQNMGRFNSNQQAIMDAVENKDYDTWKNLMEEKNNRMAQFITEDNFNKMVEMHEAMQTGDTEKADALREELDMPAIGMGMHGGRGEGFGKNFSLQNHEDIIKAIENNDYDTWKNLMGDNPITEKINADNFSRLVDSYNLMKDGKFDEAQTIRQELGVGVGMMRRK